METSFEVIGGDRDQLVRKLSSTRYSREYGRVTGFASKPGA